MNQTTFADCGLQPYAATGRADVAKVLDTLLDACATKRPLSLVRLGDGEGRLLGYPELVTKEELDTSLRIWFGRTDFDRAQLAAVACELRTAVREADIIGVPRLKQQLRIEYQPVVASIRRLALIGARQILTDCDVHRYLQFGLFYRRLLRNIEFCGLVTCRNIAPQLRDLFGIARIDEYPIPGEADFPGHYTGNHFPDRFEELRSSLRVPFAGALFLVGAGALGKIYCHWIKQAGGVAIDVGSIFDAWASVPSRLKHPCHRLQVYHDFPSIMWPDAVMRFNQLCDELALDTARLPLSDPARATTGSF